MDNQKYIKKFKSKNMFNLNFIQYYNKEALKGVEYKSIL